MDENLGRVRPMVGKRCVFPFLSWTTCLMLALMMGMGIALRHSPIPRPHLAVLYLAIGLALILSSVRCLRAVLTTPRT